MGATEVLVMIFLLAFVCEWVDSSLGMGYGTILSPVLIILGFPVLTVVPAILISQALGGLSASYFHHRFENVQFHIKQNRPSEDLKVVIAITTLGILASVFATFVGVKVLSKVVLSAYISSLILAMGIFILVGFTFRYSVRKMVLVGLISAFNKGLSGGGFGPLVTGGQMVLGNKHTNAVGITTFAEGPICIAGFASYWLLNGIERWDIVVALTVGALFASPFGAYTTRKLEYRGLREIIAILLVILGMLSLLKISGIIDISMSL